MSSKIIQAVAFSNGEIGYISWQLSDMITGCLGFEITRIYPDTPANNTVLAAWVAFTGQKNPDWKPQNTSVWPIQKLNWRDLTLRKRRDSIQRRPEEINNKAVRVQYTIRPLVPYDKSLPEVKPGIPKTYEGNVVRLSYFDEGISTNIFTVGTQYGNVRATFTNGILSTQWLTHALQEQHDTYPNIKLAIADPKSSIRSYLTGDVLDSLTLLMDKAKASSKATLKMALYELDDNELLDGILANADKVDLVLSNTSADKQGAWDNENSPARAALVKAHIKKADRMFNNNLHIGHNKFVVYLENGKPLSVMTGSTNWTPNGLCAQSNNAVVIDSPALAQLYNDYFERLKKDNVLFTVPKPLSAPTSNAQGDIFRKSNMTPNAAVVLDDKTKITVWFSPNTAQKSVVKTQTPPDLADVYSRMRKAGKAIFFAVFLPGSGNAEAGDDAIMTNIITEAISLGQKDPSLLVYGSISSPMAMPGYVPKQKSPVTYESGKMHIVRAVALTQEDIIGDFEKEMLSAGNAIIHDKIVVIDPFSENAMAVFGSHNAGFKASYGNDENLIIVENNPALVQAYAIHVLDIYEHYRTRAVIQELHDEGKQNWDGYLKLKDDWLSYALANKNDLSEYICSYQDVKNSGPSNVKKTTVPKKAASVKKAATKKAPRKNTTPKKKAAPKKVVKKKAAKKKKS
jgi:PLD-like domain